MNNCDVIDLIPCFMTGDVYILLTNLTDINRERNIIRPILLYCKHSILFKFKKSSNILSNLRVLVLFYNIFLLLHTFKTRSFDVFHHYGKHRLILVEFKENTNDFTHRLFNYFTSNIRSSKSVFVKLRIKLG
jgi:hypothetical protein